MTCLFLSSRCCWPHSVDKCLFQGAQLRSALTLPILVEIFWRNYRQQPHSCSTLGKLKLTARQPPCQ